MTISLNTNQQTNASSRRASVYPFAAIVGQDDMKLGLILNVIDPQIGGVLIMGHRGTGKSTAVRGLADLLPESWAAKDCVYHCDPADEPNLCEVCDSRLRENGKLARERFTVPVADLPLGATEDRVCGSIDVEQALRAGVKAFEPGLLARANRGFLYIDEVNLLEDHLVDLLLDVAVTGRNKVERENISVEHPARFVLIGSGNPEEGELRPQLLDRFGLHVEVKTETELDNRVEIVERREAFDRDAEAFGARFAEEQTALRQRIVKAQRNAKSVKLDRKLLRKVAQLCTELEVDGHRGELTITRASRALAAFDGRKSVSAADIKRVAGMALRHRLRRDPLEETASTDRVDQALARTFPENETGRPRGSGETGGSEGEGVAKNSLERLGDPDTRKRIARAPAPAGIRDQATAVPQLPTQRKDARSSNSRSSRSGRAKTELVHKQTHGRYVRAITRRMPGAKLALDATLRAMLNLGKSHVTAYSLRFKDLELKRGRLFVFVIDTSGSMALHRIGQAKVAVLNLLKQSYVQRDSVAIIGFRGSSAELLLPASKSILRARRALELLRVGGGTPLSAGVACALNLIRNTREQAGEIKILLFTDGHANVPLGNDPQISYRFTPINSDSAEAAIESEVKYSVADQIRVNPDASVTNSYPDRISSLNSRIARHAKIARELDVLSAALRKARAQIIVVDTQRSFVSNPEARQVAQRLGAAYAILPVSNK